MKIAALFAVLWALPMVSAQKIEPAKVAQAKPGDEITLKISGTIRRDEVVACRASAGAAEVVVQNNKTTLTVRPKEAGTLIVVCTIAAAGKQLRETHAVINVIGAAAPREPIGPGPITPPIAEPPRAAVEESLTLEALGFVPAGFMGSAQAENGGTVELDQGSTEQPHSAPACVKLTFSPQADQALGAKRVAWFAIAWQYTSGETPNWGESPGLDLEARRTGANKIRSLRLWMRGAPVGGKPPVVQLKSGGGTTAKLPKEQQASYEYRGQFQPLTAHWAERCLPVPEGKLTNVVSALTVVMERAANPGGAVIYLDDMHFSTRACDAR